MSNERSGFKRSVAPKIFRVGVAMVPRGGEAQSGRYRPGYRGWVKVKNEAYWRYGMELEGAIKSRPRMFV
jgi:hypothetical protein